MKKVRYRKRIADDLLHKYECTQTHVYTCVCVHEKVYTSGRIQWKLVAYGGRALSNQRAGEMLTFSDPAFYILQILYSEYYPLEGSLKGHGIKYNSKK